PADEGRFRQMVSHRLEADLPVSIDQLVWGYRRGAPVSSRDSARHVLTQAARDDRVTQYMTLLSAAGFSIDVLTTEAEALAAMCRYGLKLGELNDTEVLVLATADEWLVAVLAGDVIRSVRRVPVESSRIELACQQCRQCIESDQPVRSLKRILWCASPEIANVRDVLARKTEVAVEPVGPADSLVQADGGPISAEQLARFAPAIGLALAGLFERDEMIRLAGRKEESATPRQLRVERILVTHAWRWAAAAGALVILASAIHLGAVAWETKKMTRLLGAYDQNASAMARLDPKIRAMQRLEKYRIDVERIIATLCAPIPNGMVISSIQLSRERGLVVKGTAGDPKAIFALVEALRNSSRFANVQPSRTEPTKGGGFTIKADLAGVEKFSAARRRGVRWP
ncbi:MAG: hypothetical protein ACTSW2_02985, partial [Alphaproteobacteria bacterium]